MNYYKICDEIKINNKIILSRLKKETIFLELTTILNGDNSSRKANQIKDIREFFEGHQENRKFLFGIGYNHGNEKIIEKAEVDFCMMVKYEEDILKMIVGELYGHFNSLVKKDLLRRHLDILYYDQHSILEGLKDLNAQGYNYRSLLDPRFNYEEQKNKNFNLMQHLTQKINSNRTKLGIRELSASKILKDIKVIQGITLENYLFKIFNEDFGDNVDTMVRIGYSVNNTSIESDQGTKEIDLIVTGDNLVQNLEYMTTIHSLTFYPENFYNQFTF